MKIKDYITAEVRPNLQKELNLKNIFAVPTLVKIVVNVGAGEAVTDKKVLDKISSDIQAITGQRPIITKARKSISAFKIRRGMPIGIKVTLRGEKMYSFFERLVKIVLPRIRDFRGISENSLDPLGNLNLGLSEQTIFPEIEYDKIDRIRGLQITIVTSASKREEGKKLFESLGIPFRKD